MSKRDAFCYIFPIALILLFSTIDSFFTAFLVGSGAEEINPMMQLCLNVGANFFFCVKYALTACGLFILYTFQDKFVFNGKLSVISIIWFIAAIYSILIVYEVYLIWRYYG